MVKIAKEQRHSRIDRKRYRRLQGTSVAQAVAEEVALPTTSEFVVSDLVCRHPNLSQHSGASLDHHGRTAEIIFDGSGVCVLTQVSIEHHLMDETSMASPVVLRQGR